MPKNNERVIPKNIDKPIETVYEIKGDEYKVPSFEEFMKNYEYNDNLNYDDLEHIDIVDSKGYGPCTGSYCTCSRSELQDQLRKTKRELEDLRSQLSRASSWNKTVIEQNISIKIIKIEIINTRIGSLPSVNIRFEATFQGITNFYTDNSSILDFDEDTVYWKKLGWLDGSGYPYNYATKTITIKNIRQLRKLKEAIGSEIKFTFGNVDRESWFDNAFVSGCSYWEGRMKSKIEELIYKHGIGENISGSYSFSP